MSQVLDLDAVLPDDITVRLTGVEYKLPADVEAPTMLRLYRLQDRVRESQDDEIATTAAEQMYEEALDLFRARQPDLEELPITFGQIGALFDFLLSVYEEPPGNGNGARPTRAARPRPSRKSSKPSASSRPSARSRS